MAAMFPGATAFDCDISSWNTAGVTDISAMFQGETEFNGYFSRSNFNGSISSWNTASVIDLSAMFYETSEFDYDISSWDTIFITDMSVMFKEHRFSMVISLLEYSWCNRHDCHLRT